MKIYIISLILFALLFVMPSPLYAQVPDSVAVVMARAEAMHSGNFEAAAGFFAEDAVYRIDPPPPGVPDTFNGREAIHGRLAEIGAAKAFFEINIVEADASRVVSLTRYHDDGVVQGLGLPYIEAYEEYIIENGLITAYTFTITDESLTKLTVVERAAVLNAGNAELAASFFADDVIYEVVDPQLDFFLSLSGIDAVRNRMTELVDMNGKLEVEITQVDGDSVTTLAKYSDDSLRDEGVIYLEGIEEYKVQNGKIVYFKWTTQGAVTENTPQALPETGGSPFPIYLWAIVGGGLIVLSGLGLTLWQRRPA